MSLPIRPRLKDLRVGDRFYPASLQGKKNCPTYEVTGKLEFNARHGSATRMCKNLSTKRIESKSGRLEVVKLCYCIECGTRVAEANSYCAECLCEDDNF
jgi:hypothetical protein